ncbi:protein kinase [Candidatus Uabimicrobium sp. HlEnr_7]|uniref:protein kinase domain-containing protein n=1 Tax=Candidatus Uabimicrobium helgolandensis TaxID=3095367 RepID=UPI00355677F8
MKDKIIIQKALSLNIITQQQISTCLEIQKQLRNNSQEMSLLHVLLKKNFLQKSQIESLSSKGVSRGFFFNKGEYFGEYQVLDKLGSGGMGIVYKVMDINLKRVVALKLISSLDITEQEKELFLREAAACAQLNHPNIIRVFEVGNSPSIYYTMECIDGGNLKECMGKLSIKEKANLIRKCAVALDVMHRKNMIHRDIKPTNIMVTIDGQPKLMDFGLVKSTNEMSQSGKIVGTPFYMSPEQARGKDVGKLSDLYSLGATLYECLTGKKIFQEGNYIRLLERIQKEEPITLRKLNSDIPEDLETICLKTLEKNPKNRYKNMRLFAKDLQNFLENRPINASPPSKWKVMIKFFERNKYSSIGILVALMIIFIATTSYIVVLKNHNFQIQQQRKKAITEKKNAVKILMSITTSLGKFYWNHRVLQEDPQILTALTNTFQELERLEVLGSKDEELLSLYALIMSKSDQIELQEKAIAAHNILLKENPNNERIYVNRALAYQLVKKYQLALDDFQKAMKLAPQLKIYNMRANLYTEMKKYKLAEKDYFKAISLSPKDSSIRYNFGVFYHQQELYDKAIEAYKEVIVLQPHFAYPYINISAILQGQNKYSQALVYSNKAVEYNAKDPKALLGRAMIYRHLKRYDECERDLVKGLEANPKDYSLFRELAYLHRDKKNYRLALNFMEKALLYVDVNEKEDKKSIQKFIRKLKEKS